MSMATRLRSLIEGEQIVLAPGVFDGLSAKLARRVGFAAVYASGGAMSRSAGYPDLGLLSFTEVCGRIGQIVDAAEVPVIADADTGFGNVLNVYRTVRSFERLGVAALHIEDQTFPKRCGHLEGKTLVSIAEMTEKVKVAKDSLADPAFTLIARTDAIAVEGLPCAIERSLAYLEAGADMIFVEAPQSIAQVEEIAERLPQPKLINMFRGGLTPTLPAERLAALGYRVVIIPSDLQRAAIAAMQRTLAAIYRDGDSRAVEDRMVSFREREEIVETDRFLDLDRSAKR